MTFEQCVRSRRVSHAVLGAGIIERITKDGEVEVVYAQSQCKGNLVRGIYDRRWFEICGDLLSLTTLKP